MCWNFTISYAIHTVVSMQTCSPTSLLIRCWHCFCRCCGWCPCRFIYLCIFCVCITAFRPLRRRRGAHLEDAAIPVHHLKIVARSSWGSADLAQGAFIHWYLYSNEAKPLLLVACPPLFKLKRYTPDVRKMVRLVRTFVFFIGVIRSGAGKIVPKNKFRCL